MKLHKVAQASRLCVCEKQSDHQTPQVRSPRHTNLSLRQTQRLMAAAIMRPLGPGSRTQRTWTDGRTTAKVVGAFIKPNDRLSSLERLEVYNRQYWFRLIDCFYDDFPGLRAVLGENKFDALARQYLAAHPSVSFTLRNLGQFLVPFLERHPVLTAPRGELALDAARLEWAHVVAFDGPSTTPLSAEDIAGKQPGRLKLALQPHISLLELQFPVDDFVIAVKKHAALRDDASNAVSGAPERRTRRKVALPRRAAAWLAVHRVDNVVHYKRIDAAGFRLLRALQQGNSIQQACAAALAAAPDRPDWPAQIQSWFATWTRLGWLCKKVGAGRKP